MKRKVTVTVVVLAFAGYLGLSAYAVSVQSIEQLLICADRGGLKIPLSKQICRQYLLTFRGSQKDVETLQQGAGALFVTQGESPSAERAALLKFLVEKGLDPNRPDMHQLLPLHGAILANAADEVQMLLDNGANPLLVDSKSGLAPLAYALELQAGDNAKEDRKAIILLLKNAQSPVR